MSRNINLNNKTSSFHELEITKWNLEKALEVRKILTFYAYFIVITQSFQRWEFYSERVFEHVYAKKQEELRGGLLNWQLCLFCSPLNQRIVHIDHKSSKSQLKNSNILKILFQVQIPRSFPNKQKVKGYLLKFIELSQLTSEDGESQKQSVPFYW